MVDMYYAILEGLCGFWKNHNIRTRLENMILSGKGPASKSDEFLEKFRTAFDPPPSFLES